MFKRFVCLTSLVVMLAMIGTIRAELIGHWTLDETSGTTAADTSGRGHDGAYVDSPGLDIPGVRGTGMDAAGGYMEVDLGDDLPIQAEERTIALWVNTPEVRGDRKFCGYGSDTAGQAMTFCIENVNGEDGVRMRHWGGNMFYTGFITGQWNHITIRVLPGAVIVNETEVFIDGKNIPGYRSGGSDQTLNTAATPFYVGTSIAGQTGQVFEGLLDDVYFYDHALSDVEILSVMEGEPWPYAFGPNPDDGALHPDTWITLSWSPGDFAVSHDVYLGENFDDVDNGTGDTFRGNQTSTMFIAGFPGFAYPEGLVPGTTYYWRIDEVNEADPNSPWKGSVWSFSIPPKTAYSPNPPDGAEFVDPNNVTLTWTPGFGAILHTLYLGDDFNEVNNATGGVPLGSVTYKPDPLELEKVYYWRVDEFDAVDTHKGDVWSFTTPGAVGNPQPTYNAMDVPLNAILSWTPADSAASHEFYFGTDKAAVRNADTGSPEYKGSRTLGAESYDPGLLDADTAYYWRVDEKDAQGNTAKGPLWTFTAGAYLLVDDFESYTDDDAAGESIWQTWIDGFGVADNGAQVGYLMPPYAEQTIVHGGSQSMPILYTNEAGVTNSEASLTLTAPRDWTLASVAELSLWFRGGSANAAEPLYISASNAAGAPAVVAHDDLNAAQISRWTQWIVPLQAIADQGINLTNIDKITIGLGSKAGVASSGGSGMMYIDDIRLYPPTP
ncbi:LamG-like jellyroll fold domain-containing protein [Planctomycetota bacterium]